VGEGNKDDSERESARWHGKTLEIERKGGKGRQAGKERLQSRAGKERRENAPLYERSGVFYSNYLQCLPLPARSRLAPFSVVFGPFVLDFATSHWPLLRFRRLDWFARSPLSFGLPALSFSAARSRLPFLTLYVMYVWYL